MLKPLVLLLSLAFAVEAAAAPRGQARWFRYYDDKNQPVVTDTVTPDHILHGYDELTPRMQMIRHIEAQRPLTPEEQAAARAKRDQALQQARDDKQMLRLYASPADAERARNRQLDALQVRIDFATNSINSLRQRRTGEAQKAATFERTGKPVPPDLKKSIETYDHQISVSQAEINDRKADQQRVRDEFEPMIQRLGELTGKPVGTVPISVPAAAPAATSAAAAKPAAAPAAAAPRGK